MKERFKTILLLFLIGLSIFMTRKIWLKSPDEVLEIVKNTTEKENLEESYPLIDMISSSKYLLNFNSGNHTLIYEDGSFKIWDKVEDVLKDVFKEKDLDITQIENEEYLSYKEDMSVVFYFSEETNTYILARALDVKRPNDIVDTMPKVDRIYFYLGIRDPFFVFSNEKNHVKVSLSDVDLRDLREIVMEIDKKGNYPYYYSMRETLGTENDIFIPYEVNYSLPEIYVENKVLNYSDEDRVRLAESFLGKNIDYIREIVENNNSSIYLYDKEVLKLNTNGTVEYFKPLEERVSERNLYQSLMATASFISDKPTTDKGMYLSRVEDIEVDGNQGYRLTFRYKIRGIPVILGNQEVGEYVEIETFNNNIRSYKYYARKETTNISNNAYKNKENLISAFEAIDKNYNLLEEWYDMDTGKVEESKEVKVNTILSSIKDINLAYYDPCLKDNNEKLIAVWIIKFENRLVAFDAYNGMLVYERSY